MQTKREYLVSLGLAKEGRGKFSNAAKEALVKAEAKGITFADVVPVTVKKATKNATGGVTDKSPVTETRPETKPGDSLYLSPCDFRFPEDQYVAVDGNGKKYSMRECCNTCMVSLTNHACNTPTVHDNVTVHIRERK